METPVRITFRDIDPSEFVERRVREEVRKLERFYGRLTACTVALRAPHRKHQKGTTYRVAINLSAPVGDIVVTRDPGANHAHEDIYVAIRDAFRTARRQIEDKSRRRREESHGEGQPRLTGTISRLFSEEGYGFIETEDGAAFYFHEDDVVHNGFDRLDVDNSVRFVETTGQSGPRAGAVMPT